ncbi:uncharacterized protein LOC117642120 isoform X2 [Thrips palmi]|nr:uncharacterized protein LOC117642120 isoform X2 [Thrips palmi]XP_034235857.1 uncharacterized protein LOC117642120 isoform X2 [Thrips palmi]XP_034235859.1 uncharacterized protein LOC117642120 isoform X2 [Thrips palmi]
MNGLDEEPGSSCDSGNASCSRMSNGHNDCSNQLSNGTSNASSSSTAYGGARPKTREFEENIPNGVLHQSPQTRTQNDSKVKKVQNEASTSGSFGISNNLSNDTIKVIRQIRDIECQAGPSQPYVEKSCDNGENDVSRLAAVCAASSRRAMAERARKAEPHSAKRLQSPVDSDNSSDTGNDDGLSGDECCIYTYKGDQNADISNGLLGLSLPQVNEHPPAHPVDNGNRNGGSSPEMDFLEMDFDPDPLGEQDSIEEDHVQVNLLIRPEVASPSQSVEEASNELSAPASSLDNASTSGGEDEEDDIEDEDEEDEDEEGAVAMMESSDSSNEEMPDAEPEPFLGINVGALTSTSTSADGMKNLFLPKVPSLVSKEILRGQHIAGSQLCPVDIDDSHKRSFVSAIKSWHTNNEPVIDKQKFNLYSALYHSIMANNLILDEEELGGASGSQGQGREDNNVEGAVGTSSEGCPRKRLHQQSGNELPELEKTMIWTEREACHKQVSQIAVSACGAAAVSNVLSALNIPFTLERVHDGVATRLRAEKACLPTYLFSRSAAGVAHNDLIRGLDLASDGAIYSRFFHMYPERSFSLSRWLAHWIKEGAVPIATLNIQKSVLQGATIPDSWHHQMVFGVSHRGIYLTNPLECVREEVLHPQLCSPSELLVRRQDIVSRWAPNTDLCRLATSSDIRWKQMNVLGQVVNILREANARAPQYLFRRNLTSHISIPASYCSGILLSVPKDSRAAMQLKSAPELPMKVF